MSDGPQLDPQDTKRVVNTLAAMKAVHDDAAGFRGIVGRVPCPACDGGMIAYAVAATNGHTRGRCSTPNCLTWIE